MPETSSQPFPSRSFSIPYTLSSSRPTLNSLGYWQRSQVASNRNAGHHISEDDNLHISAIVDTFQVNLHCFVWHLSGYHIALRLIRVRSPYSVLVDTCQFIRQFFGWYLSGLQTSLWLIRFRSGESHLVDTCEVLFCYLSSHQCSVWYLWGHRQCFGWYLSG